MCYLRLRVTEQRQSQVQPSRVTRWFVPPKLPVIHYSNIQFTQDLEFCRYLHRVRTSQGPILQGLRTRITHRFPPHCTIGAGQILTDTYRMMQDLLYPHNDHVHTIGFRTEWGTFPDVSTSWITTYRAAPVHPRQQHQLCFAWRRKMYVARAVAFGLSPDADVYGAVSDMFVAVNGTRGCAVIWWMTSVE